MVTGTVATSMHIWREGGIAGIQRLATISDPAIIEQIQTYLAQTSAARPHRAADMFQYVFEVRGGKPDSNFRAERHLPENALSMELRALLKQLTFETTKTR